MKPSILVAGDDAEAKRITGTLAENAGFPWLDVGPLKMAQSIERLPLLIHSIAEANGGDDGLPRFSITFLTPPFSWIWVGEGLSAHILEYQHVMRITARKRARLRT